MGCPDRSASGGFSGFFSYVFVFVKIPGSLFSRFIGPIPSVMFCQSNGLIGRIGVRGGASGSGVALRSIGTLQVEIVVFGIPSWSRPAFANLAPFCFGYIPFWL